MIDCLNLEKSKNNFIFSLPLIATFTKSHMSFEIDRDPSIEPSLKEMTSKALSILYDSTKNSEEGFFLMIEGSRVDQ